MDNDKNEPPCDNASKTKALAEDKAKGIRSLYDGTKTENATG